MVCKSILHELQQYCIEKLCQGIHVQLEVVLLHAESASQQGALPARGRLATTRSKHQRQGAGTDSKKEPTKLRKMKRLFAEERVRKHITAWEVANFWLHSAASIHCMMQYVLNSAQKRKTPARLRLVIALQPTDDPDEEERAARYAGYRLEDERDAHLLVDIGRHRSFRRPT